MGNLKKYGGKLTDNWHLDQLNLQKLILKRYNELGINYVLPAFAGFVPDKIQKLYPTSNFTVASDWLGLGCNYSW
jgi:alpha-N-acetylglucosaminidase